MRSKRMLYIKYMSRRLRHKLLIDKLGMKYPKTGRICGQPIPSDEEANGVIAQLIREGKPFSLLRPGNAEYSLVSQWDEHILFGTKRYRKQKMFDCIDRNDGLAQKWAETFEQDLKDADVIACFGKCDYMEHYLIEAYAKPKRIIMLGQIEVMQLENPWLSELKGKKVLVISPFVETMEKQYEKRSQIWGGREILPEMDIRFLKSVWYMSAEDNSGFADWFEALEYLYEEAGKIDFDIALIGCGPFSTFLAARFKRNGKQAIQYGGALQMLFGVRGARWDNMEKYSRYFNEHWVRAPIKEAPAAYSKLDDRCYW